MKWTVIGLGLTGAQAAEVKTIWAKRGDPVTLPGNAVVPGDLTILQTAGGLSVALRNIQAMDATAYEAEQAFIPVLTQVCPASQLQGVFEVYPRLLRLHLRKREQVVDTADSSGLWRWQHEAASSVIAGSERHKKDDDRGVVRVVQVRVEQARAWQVGHLSNSHKLTEAASDDDQEP